MDFARDFPINLICALAPQSFFPSSRYSRARVEISLRHFTESSGLSGFRIETAYPSISKSEGTIYLHWIHLVLDDGVYWRATPRLFYPYAIDCGDSCQLAVSLEAALDGGIGCLWFLSRPLNDGVAAGSSTPQVRCSTSLSGSWTVPRNTGELAVKKCAFIRVGVSFCLVDGGSTLN